MSRYQSLLLRASREASRLSTNPTRSKPISVIRDWKPDRCSAEAPLLPRSSSITCTRSDGQPSWVARSTNWYWGLQKDSCKDGHSLSERGDCVMFTLSTPGNTELVEADGEGTPQRINML